MKQAFRHALRGLREHTYLAGVGTGVIAAALVLLGGYAMIVSNLESVVSGWKQDVHVSAYFTAEQTAEAQALALAEMAARPEVATVELVTSAQATAWMLERVPEVATMVQELGEGALPASLEISLRPAYTSPVGLDGFADSMRVGGRFSEIDYGRDWVERAGAFLRTLTILGVALGTILVIAALFLVGNTINLVVYARRDELEILRLVGATDGYIVSPFLVEGAIQGVVAGFGALALLFSVHSLVLARLPQAIPIALGEGGVSFLSAGSSLGLVVLGGAIGVAAAGFAVRRFLSRLA
jgi:cell division transport system permease protein